MVQTGLPNQPEAETRLAFAADAARTAVDAALEAEDFAAAMTALAALRGPVDAFFTDVLVNSDVAAERDNRLKLLGQVRAVMGKVADFWTGGGVARLPPPLRQAADGGGRRGQANAGRTASSAVDADVMTAQTPTAAPPAA